MYEEITVYYEPISEVDNSTPTDPVLSEQIIDSVNKVLSENNFDETVDFTNDTDDSLYTVTPAGAPTSSAQQQTIYLLEIRNILFIFLFSWFVLTIYSKLKNLIINYFD